MAFQDLNVSAANTNNNMSEVVGNAKAKIHEILGGTYSKISNNTFFGIGGDFTGINTEGLVTLQQAITKYCAGIENTVNGFNENANIAEAFKGDLADAVTEFVRETKKLLINYVTNIKRNNQEASVIFEKYKSYTEQGKTDIGTGADEIRANAESIQFDDGTGNN